MMDAVFLKLLNMSLTAGWLILAVIVLRLVLKKAPKWTRCILWGIVGLRLVFPFSIESALSLIPSAETVSPNIVYAQTPGITSGIPALNQAVNPIITESLSPTVGASVNPLQIWTTVAGYVWLAGIAAMLLYTAISYFRLRHKVDTAVLLRDNIWQSENVKSPFILGLFRPRIYLPFHMSDNDMANVLAHENAHLRRRDHWWKPLAFLLLSVYWFNPMIWLAYILLCRDIELACDERIVKGLDEQERKDYGTALLSCSVSRKSIAACPLAFGEVGVKERIKTVLNYKKPTFWIILVAVVACVVVAVCFLTNPKSDNSPYVWTSDVSIEDVTWCSVTVWDTGDNYEANESQLVNLITALNNAPRSAITDGRGIPRKISIMLLCGNREYLLNYAGGIVELAFDSETAMLYDQPANAVWQIEDASLSEVMESFIGYERTDTVLSLNDVIMLSAKGEALTWSDFDGWVYLQTVYGDISIRQYDIDSRFCLWVAGVSDQKPRHILLAITANADAYDAIRDGTTEAGSPSYIDVRTESVTEFIEAHEMHSASTTGGAVQEDFAYEITYAWANYSEDGYNAMVEQAENRDTERRYGNISHLTPVVKLDNRSDYNAFYEEMSAYFDLAQGYDEVGSFSELEGRYTEDFFTDNTLFIAYLAETSASYRHEVEYARVENDVFEVGIRLIAPSEVDTAMAGWFMCVAVPKAAIADCTGFDAYICATSDPNSASFPSGKLVRLYSFPGEDTLQGASVSLYDSGEFTMSFSPISSYWGHGTYTIDGDRLTLNTDDGNFTYVFDMLDDTLVFDADASSSMTWYSGMKDGSIFQ